MIYFDNASTSFPKPEGVIREMNHFMEKIGANPGRSGHRLSIEAERILYKTRRAIADLFRVEDPLRIVFTSNATEGINLVLKGCVKPGDHVITSGMEHNSVMRPLRELEKQGVSVTIAPCGPDGSLDPAKVKDAIRDETVLIILNHSSNIVGTILPVEEIATIAHEHNILLAADAAQTAGALPINLSEADIDFFIFTGHKSLYGPQGTGGIVLGEHVEPARLYPLKTGGTGSSSEKHEQPDFLPDRYESGTPNTVGLAGLGSGARFVLSEGIDTIRKHEMSLLKMLMEGLRKIDRVTVYGPASPANMTATVSFRIDGISPSEAGLRLDEEYDIMCRIGLHCAPSAHRSIGTFPEGTIRFSLGYFSKEEEVKTALRSVRKLARG